MVGGREACSKRLSSVFFSFYAVLMLCLIAGGKHHAPLSGNRVGRPKLGISGEDFGEGTKRLPAPLGFIWHGFEG